jgi:TRAP-type C4-dicarboxylate transport system permease small subunit
MDPRDSRTLQKILELTEENNHLLKKMRRSQALGRFMTILYWVIIIGITAGAFYFVQPYIDRIVEAYTTVTNTAQQTKDTLNQLKGSDAGQYLLR